MQRQYSKLCITLLHFPAKTSDICKLYGIKPSQWWVSAWQPYGIWSHAVWLMGNNVSEEPPVSIQYVWERWRRVQTGTAGSPETLICIYQTTWCHVSEDCNLNVYTYFVALKQISSDHKEWCNYTAQNILIAHVSHFISML